MDYRQIERILTRNGWILVRTLSSSRQYKKAGFNQAVVVAHRSGGDISAGVVKNLEKATGLSLWR